MARRKTTGGDKPRAVQVVRSDAEIDQILDSLDQALLAGNRDRMQALTGQIWEMRERMPDVLMQRLIDGRSQVPGFAFELIGGFAGQQARTYLKRIAEERSAPDIVRFGARRRAGWPERGEAKRRQTFLASLQDPEGTLILAIDQSTQFWPPDGEVLQEVLGYLAGLPSDRQQAVVARAIQELGMRAAWLLHALLHVDDSATQRLALSELVRLREPGAAGPIARLAQTARQTEMRVEATAATRRLRLQVVDRGEPTAFPPLPAVDRALLSTIDGDGAQVIIVVRRWGEGAFLFADFLRKDDWGIKDTFGVVRAPADQLEHLLSEFPERGIDLVAVDLAAVRGTLASAIEENATTGHGIPPAFELWEPLVHESYPPPAGEPVTLPELDDAAYAGRLDLIRSTDQLAEHAFFDSWLFKPQELFLAMMARPPRAGGRLTDREYRPLVDQLVDAPVRAHLRQRLRRQAWLLEKAGQPARRDQALAAAAALAATDPAELAKLPFLRKMIERSVASLMSTLPVPPFGE